MKRDTPQCLYCNKFIGREDYKYCFGYDPQTDTDAYICCRRCAERLKKDNKLVTKNSDSREAREGRE